MAEAKCIFLFEVEVDAGSRCPMHRHACTELVYTGQAAGKLHQGADVVEYGPQQLIVYQPGPAHWVVNRKPGRHFCVGVIGCGADRLRAGVWPASRDVTEWINRLRATDAVGDAHRERLDLMSGLLVLDVARLQRADPEPRRLPPALAAREIIDTRFDEIVGVQEVASSLFISPDYLRQLFKRQFGLSPLKYLIRRRIEVAEELLKDPKCTVSDVAARCGFESPYYLARMFKKITGRTPTQGRGR